MYIYDSFQLSKRNQRNRLNMENKLRSHQWLSTEQIYILFLGHNLIFQTKNWPQVEDFFAQIFIYRIYSPQQIKMTLVRILIRHLLFLWLLVLSPNSSFAFECGRNRRNSIERNYRIYNEGTARNEYPWWVWTLNIVWSKMICC